MDPLEREGWERRFVAAPPRLEEAVALYESMGFEVRLEPVGAPVDGEPCAPCAPALARSRAVYTRRRG